MKHGSVILGFDCFAKLGGLRMGFGCFRGCPRGCGLCCGFGRFLQDCSSFGGVGGRLGVPGFFSIWAASAWALLLGVGSPVAASLCTFFRAQNLETNFNDSIMWVRFQLRVHFFNLVYKMHITKHLRARNFRIENMALRGSVLCCERVVDGSRSNTTEQTFVFKVWCVFSRFFVTC